MLYQDGQISVDYDFARFGAKSYAINKINTVDVNQRKTRGKGAAIFWMLIGAFCILAAFSGATDSRISWALIGVVLVALGAILYRRPDVYEYDLFLRTSSSDAAAFKTNDDDQILRLRTAIESAMAGAVDGARR